MNALVVANGTPPSPELLQSLLSTNQLIVAADGAADFLYDHGLRDFIVIGDFDSVSPEILNSIPVTHQIRDDNQENSDLEKAIQYCASKNADRIFITGTTGKRLDHTLTAVSLMVKYAGLLRMRMITDEVEVLAVAVAAEIIGKPGDIISLIAMGEAKSVNLTGVKWPLKDETILPGSRGVSNVMISNKARITVGRGVVLLTHTR